MFPKDLKQLNRAKNMRIGITPGVYKNKKYDSLKTLDFAAGKINKFFRAEVVQILTNDKLIRNPDLCAEIAGRARQYKIELITHASAEPFDPDKATKAHAALLKYQGHKRAVFHYTAQADENQLYGLAECGFQVFVENVHRGIVKRREKELHDSFFRFIIRNKPFFGCALDFGRYFQNASLSMLPEITKKAVDNVRILKKFKIPVIYHVTGYKNLEQKIDDQISCQNPRNKIPYKNIFLGISDFSRLDLSIAVIENEKIDDVISGAKYLRSIAVN